MRSSGLIEAVRASTPLVVAGLVLACVSAVGAYALGEQPATIRGEFVNKFFTGGGVRLETVKGVATVQPDGSLVGQGRYHYSYRNEKMFQQGEADVKLRGTLKGNEVSLYNEGGEEYAVTGHNQWGPINSHANVGGCMMAGELVDGKFHGVVHEGSHEGDPWSITVTLELIGGTDDDDQPADPADDTTADDEPAVDDAPTPDEGNEDASNDDDKPDDEFCRRCADVKQRLDALESEFAQIAARQAGLSAELAGLQAELQAWKQTLQDARRELLKAQAAQSTTLIDFWKGQIDKAHVALKQVLAKVDDKQAQIEQFKQKWSQADQKRLDNVRQEWLEIRDRCAGCSDWPF